jgi:hypothetical protein
MLQSLVRCATADDGKFVMRDESRIPTWLSKISTGIPYRRWRECIGQYCPEAPTYVRMPAHDLAEIKRMTAPDAHLGSVTAKKRATIAKKRARATKTKLYAYLREYGYTENERYASRQRLDRIMTGAPYAELTLAEYARVCWRFDWLYAAYIAVWYTDPTCPPLDLTVWIRYIVYAENMRHLEVNFPPLSSQESAEISSTRLEACRALLTRRGLDISPDSYTRAETYQLAASRSALIECTHMPDALVDCIVLPYIAPTCVWPPFVL